MSTITIATNLFISTIFLIIPIIASFLKIRNKIKDNTLIKGLDGDDIGKIEGDFSDFAKIAKNIFCNNQYFFNNN